MFHSFCAIGKIKKRRANAKKALWKYAQVLDEGGCSKESKRVMEYMEALFSAPLRREVWAPPAKERLK